MIEEHPSILTARRITLDSMSTVIHWLGLGEKRGTSRIESFWSKFVNVNKFECQVEDLVLISSFGGALSELTIIKNSQYGYSDAELQLLILGFMELCFVLEKGVKPVEGLKRLIIDMDGSGPSSFKDLIKILKICEKKGVQVDWSGSFKPRSGEF